jgi:hypothetical protein
MKTIVIANQKGGSGKSTSTVHLAVDNVFISQSAASGRAASAEQFYVSVSRGREMARIYVDQKDAVREAITGERQRMSATELVRTPRSMSPLHRHSGFRHRMEVFEHAHPILRSADKAQLLHNGLQSRTATKEEIAYDR